MDMTVNRIELRMYDHHASGFYENKFFLDVIIKILPIANSIMPTNYIIIWCYLCQRTRQHTSTLLWREVNENHANVLQKLLRFPLQKIW